MRRWGRWARIGIVSVALAAMLLLFVFPTRSFLTQRHDISRARQDLQVIRSENERLSQEAARLAAPAEIERIAREQYHMVRPGERAFVVVPSRPAASDAGADAGSDTPPTTADG